MIGKGLIKKLVAALVAAGAAFVAVVALGATIFYALSLVLVPLGAAALTAALFAAVAAGVAFAFLKSDDEDEEEEEPEDLKGRAIQLLKHHPVLGGVAALVGGWIFLRNPALATLVAAAVADKRGRRRF